MKKSLVLTGMMGVGKSTIGKLLSEKLKMKFIDTDELIEKEEKMSIKKIFNLKGEAYFRTLEKKISLANLESKNTIISLGGGTFIDQNIREKVLKSCISFWLDVDLNILISRIKDSSKRPLLEKNNLKISMEQIYKKRKSSYNLANYRINCNNFNKKIIVKEILGIYINVWN